MIKVFILLILAIPTFANSEIYKWVDENGRTHFGDSPREQDKAEKVVVNVISYKYIKVENISFYQSESRKNGVGKVEMFSTSWCGYCKKARDYFNEQKISFVEYDIEKDPKANQRFKELGGTGVPVILVGEKKMSGFSVGRFKSIYP